MKVALKDRNKQIPNGFSFLVPETNWDSRKVLPKFPSLTVLTNALIQHRLGNVHLVKKHGWATDYKTVADEVADYNAQICVAHGWTDFIVSDAPIERPPPSPDGPQGLGAHFAANIKRTGSGMMLMKDWLGAGLKPVEKELAEKRASICVVCPLNQPSNLMQRMDAVVARKIKTLMEIKNDLDLKTSFDSQLKTCSACDCLNELKIWTPLDLILKNTSADVMGKLDAKCWVLRI